MCGAKFHGLFALELNRVNGDDALGASQTSTLNGVGTDSANTHNGDCVTRLHFGRVHRRTPASHNATAQEADLVKWQIVVNLDATGFVHHGVMSEGSEQAHQAQFLTTSVVT